MRFELKVLWKKYLESPFKYYQKNEVFLNPLDMLSAHHDNELFTPFLGSTTFEQASGLPDRMAKSLWSKQLQIA